MGTLFKAIFLKDSSAMLQIVKSIYKFIWHLIVSVYHFIVAFAHNHPVIFIVICAVFVIMTIISILNDWY